jgi:putative transposase
MRRQCQLIGLPRSSYYYQPATESEENLKLMRLIDEQHTEIPFYGSRKMTAWLKQQKFNVNRKRVVRLMRLMCIEAVYPAPKTSQRDKQHKIYPYLLRNMEIVQRNQVLATDITYVPMTAGFMYLVAVIDWFSRYVISWEISNTMDEDFCLRALDSALRRTQPIIFNTDQGSQFSGQKFTRRLKDAEVWISMTGRGRCMDNIIVERLWRTVKYENIYRKEYEDGLQLYKGLV